METEFNFLRSVNPVYNSIQEKEWIFPTGNTIGTCFPISSDYFLTAAHVIEGISLDRVGTIGIFRPDDNRGVIARIIDKEIFQCDLALFKVEYPNPICKDWLVIPPWLNSSLNIFDHLRSIGFPYGDAEVEGKPKIVIRGQQGYVAGIFSGRLQSNRISEPHPIIELSYAAPRGLSGAPVYKLPDGLVCGMVIGNSEQKLLVKSYEELSSDGVNKHILEQYESLVNGVAIPSWHILDLFSNLLKKTFREFLSFQNLL